MKFNLLFEDQEILVVEKPIGIESQSARSFEPDMVSEIKKHINNISPVKGEPYVGVIHRLDKPVGGVMVYAKTKKSAEALSKQVSTRKTEKSYYAVVCGKPVENFGTYVDYLWRDGKNNCSKIVDKGINGAKQAELAFQVMGEVKQGEEIYSLLKIKLITGRHHQIRVQMAAHGTPIWGDRKYNKKVQNVTFNGNLALHASSFAFMHPRTGKKMNFYSKPSGGMFDLFSWEN
ncbi:RluA family pseudouridine synthase [Clostridium sp. E02]|uniref:RluA family pseudouridine synthase n=1 Tax=Clostridium sp. E02 TaxID=2487134 RepID=UPI000F523440|nr:RluA family pseudouridine synthase [Clostridium sp. E02]